MSHTHAGQSQGAAAPSPFRQPKAVWAVAFACVISFMGIGLVDPILPALSSQLHASPTQVTLLFTSYLVVTAGGGLDFHWTPRVTVRAADFEYQDWPQFTFGDLHPYGVSSGISLRIW